MHLSISAFGPVESFHLYCDDFGAVWVCFLPPGASDGNNDSDDGRTPYFGTKTQRDWVNGSKAIKANSDTNSASYI
jgi:hypothetical protein